MGVVLFDSRRPRPSVLLFFWGLRDLPPSLGSVSKRQVDHHSVDSPIAAIVMKHNSGQGEPVEIWVSFVSSATRSSNTKQLPRKCSPPHSSKYFKMPPSS